MHIYRKENKKKPKRKLKKNPVVLYNYIFVLSGYL